LSDNRLVYRNPEKEKSTLKKERLSSESFIHPLTNRLVAVLNSPGFPSLSIIRGRNVTSSARIYAHEDHGLAIFMSELNFDQLMHHIST